MSAWSAAAGKPQISYAERLRNAAKAPAQSSQPSSSSGPRIVSTNISQPQQAQSQREPAESVGKQAPSPESTTIKANQPLSTTSAGTIRQNSDEGKAQPSSADSKPKVTGPPALNIWEARKKQLAEKEAEKERQALSQAQKKANASALATEKQSKTTSNNSNPPAQPTKSKHTKGVSSGEASISGSKKEQSQKGGASGTNDKKGGKQAVGTSTASSGGTKAQRSTKQDSQHPVSSSSTQSKGDTPAKSKATKSAAQTGGDAGTSIQSAKAPSKATDESGAKAGSTNKAASKYSAPAIETTKQATSSASTLHPLPSPPPATTDLATEQAISGVVEAPRAEEDDAWLARIHLLNGGQNMPNFDGGFKLGEAEEDAQAARKAERAVAAAWGAGKNVWQQKTGQLPEPQQEKPKAAVNGTTKAKKSSEAQPQAATPKKGKLRSSNASKGQAGSVSTPIKTIATSSPLGDLNSWPSPLDAGKKENKPKQADSVDLKAADAPQGSAKKSKQWIPIVPTITHNTPSKRASQEKPKPPNKVESKPPPESKSNGRPAHLPPTPRFPIFYDPLMHQIEFYFSPQNLTGDFFLRQKMDVQGWVDIQVVAAFNRVKSMTTDIKVVRDTIMVSPNLDVDTEKMKVRKRHGWEEWLLL